jgi:hypothetical protein
MAKWFMGVRVMPPDTTDGELKPLVETVHGLADRLAFPNPKLDEFSS